jgi:hypothetical protein
MSTTTTDAFFPTKRIGVVIATTTTNDDDDDDASAPASASVIARSCGIVTQNVNGPCPLLAVVNAMLLRDDVTIGDLSMSADGGDGDVGVDVGGVSLDGIVRVLAKTMRKRALGAQPDEDAEPDANAVAVLNDATSALYDFASGMDVNVKFNACDGFEYTREMSVFDLCGLRLVHSWVVGQAEHGADAVRVAGDGTAYNSLVERLISLKTEIEEGVGSNGRGEGGVGAVGASERLENGESAREEDLVARAVALSLADSKDASLKDAELANKVRDATAMEDFLSSTASQLTRTGLEAMRTAIGEGEYVVWFRNNHFSVVVKRDGQLYALVTDQGYLHEPDVVWEGLGGARDGDFVDSKFQPFVPHAGQGGGLGIEDADYEAAIAASRAESGGATTNASSSAAAAALPPEFLRTADVSSASGATAANVDADHALALRLQAQFEEEERASRIAAERRAAARSLENPAPTASRRIEDPSRRREKTTKKKDKKKSSSAASDVCVIM